MQVLDPGHRYLLDNLKSKGQTEFAFFKDPKHHEGRGYFGPSTQEVMRMVIDRVKHLDSEEPWEGNQLIVQKARDIIALFEARALLRKVSKGDLEIDELPVGPDGHIILQGAE